MLTQMDNKLGYQYLVPSLFLATLEHTLEH